MGALASPGTCTSVRIKGGSEVSAGADFASGELDLLGISNVAQSRKQRGNDSELRQYYGTLHDAWGPQHWWPAESAFEVIVGAYLTQNTAWINVERALGNLRTAGCLNVAGIRGVRVAKLQRLIRSSGYFRQKAQRLKTFVAFLDRKYGGSLERMLARPTSELREELLGLNGVGPETADSILLYAGNHAVFVVDAYTRRILERHAILPARAEYEEIRELFQRALTRVAEEQRKDPVPVEVGSVRGAAHPPSAMSTAKRTALAQVYNEMHGLIVGVGKLYCGKSRAKCEECPLREFLPSGN